MSFEIIQYQNEGRREGVEQGQRWLGSVSEQMNV